MSSIKGTNVLAPVVPFDTTDSHASHEARYGKGGYRSVADIAERDAIPQLRREAGMLVLTLSDGKLWKLAADLAAWSEISVAGPQGIPGVAGAAGATGPQGPAGSNASATTDAAALTSGTLPDARLSSNVPLLTNLTQYLSQPSTAIETFSRSHLAFSGLALVSGQLVFVFFTPLMTTTVSQIAMSVVSTAASGLSLARMGLFTFDESTATLVARTASDTTLFTATRTVYTRSFNTTGGYPATYTLNAGTRYGVGVIAVGTTMPQLSGTTPPFEIATLAPKLSAARSSQPDLGTVGSLGTTSAVPYARLS